MTFPARHISVSIGRPPGQVYAFASRPENLPRWAAGLGTAVRNEDNRWVADSPMGRIEVAFAPANPHGILDHDVTLPTGEVVHNPLRILRNDGGSEVVFTLYRRPGVSDRDYEADAAAVRRDLETLKRLVEG
jgi:uncharacterized protein YndB with AHSA1/START domain